MENTLQYFLYKIVEYQRILKNNKKYIGRLKIPMKKFICFTQALLMTIVVSLGSLGTAFAAVTVSDADTLNSAIKSAGTSATEIVLADDITIDSMVGVPAITISSGQNVTIDLNGKSLNFTGLTILSVNAGTLMIKNGSIKTTSGNAALSAENGAKIYLENVTGTSASSELIYSDSSE